MAALLRFGAARACRLLASHTLRNPSIYQRTSPDFYQQHILKACLPSVSVARCINNETHEAKRADRETDEPFGYKDSQNFRGNSRPGQKAYGGFNYERNVRQLGTIVMRPVVLRTVKEILHREGKITSLQAYQAIRNCGSELRYERPEKRIELAHYLWDKIVSAGVEPDVMLYNGLLNVYLQNDHNFNPLEVLEQMESNKVEPNTTTLLLLIEGYAQKGDVAGAFKVLEFIKAAQMPLTEQVFASLVTAYGLSGDLDSARGVFDLMRENGLEPDIYSYSALLCAYGAAGDTEAIMKTIDEMQEKRVYPNNKVILSLLDVISKRGYTTLIKELLQKPIIRSLLEGNLRELMLTVANRGEIVSALILAGHMSEATTSYQNDFHKQEMTLIKQVIVSGQSLDVIMVTIQELHKRLGAVTNVYEYALNESYGTKNPEICFVILQEMLKKNCRVRNHYFFPLLAMYANKRNSKGAHDVVTMMGEYGFQPDGMTLRFLMKSYGDTVDANQVESFMNFTKGVPTSKIVLKSLAQLVMSTGQLEKLEKTIEHIKQEDMNILSIGDAFEDYLNQSNFDPHNGVEILKILHKHDCAQHMSSKIWNKFLHSDKDKVKDNAKFVELLLNEGLGNLMDSRAYTAVLHQFQSIKMSNEFYDFVQTMKKHQVTLDGYHYKQLLLMLGYDGKAEAAQFCFEKLEQLTELTKNDYSALMQAYANCPEGGITAPVPHDRNMRRICQLFNAMSSKGFQLSTRAKGAACIAHLTTGQYDRAEEIRSIHGPGEPQFKVLHEFMRYYSKHGDVRKTLETMEEMSKIKVSSALPAFVYNNVLHAYGFHGDSESQWKVFDEMKQNNVAPTRRTYSKLMQGYLTKNDVNAALKIFQDAKEQGSFIENTTAILLLNCMARSGQTEHFESAMEDITANRLSTPPENVSTQSLLRGLMFCCIHAGKKELALKLQLEHDVEIKPQTFNKLAENSGLRGEVNAILNVIEFMKENNVEHSSLYLPLIRAYETKRDVDSVKAVYNKMLDDGVKIDDRFLQHYNHIMMMSSEATPFNEPSPTEEPVKAQTIQDDSDSSSSDDERGEVEETEKDIEEVEEVEEVEELNDLK